jgi:hypothetical protein
LSAASFIAFGQRCRHRFFYDNVLAAFGGGHHVAGVEMVRRGDIDGIDIGAVAHRFDARKCFAAINFAEFLQRVGAHVRRRGDFDEG